MDTLNVLNPKALEKQLKVLDTRLAELHGEIRELEKRRTACLILMGDTVDFAAPEAPTAAAETKPAKVAKAKPSKSAEPPVETSATELPERIAELLKEMPQGLSADDIYDTLKERGVTLGSKNAVGRVYSTLEQFPDRFVEGTDGAWRVSEAPQVP